VPRWLAEPPLRGLVIGCQPASPRHGGDGALYILLKRIKSGDRTS
jgi:DNA-nicking Smr family endonuclease